MHQFFHGYDEMQWPVGSSPPPAATAMRRSLRAQPRRESGLSPIENVVAAVVLAFISLALASSTMHARRVADSSRWLAEATTLAVDKLEELRSLSPGASQLAAAAHSDAANPLRADGVGGGAFTRTWSVTADLPVSGMKRIEVTVSWPSTAGRAALTLVTYQVSA